MPATSTGLSHPRTHAGAHDYEARDATDDILALPLAPRLSRGTRVSHAHAAWSNRGEEIRLWQSFPVLGFNSDQQP